MTGGHVERGNSENNKNKRKIRDGGNNFSRRLLSSHYFFFFSLSSFRVFVSDDKTMLSPISESSSAEEQSEMFGDIYDKIGKLGQQITEIGDSKRLSDLKLDQATAKIEAMATRFNASDARMHEIHRQLELLLKTFPARETVREHGASSQLDSPSTQDFRHQNPYTYPEPARRDLSNSLGTRENLLKNVDMSVFEGTETYSWIARVERFF